jgi:hypothetical protein
MSDSFELARIIELTKDYQEAMRQSAGRENHCQALIHWFSERSSRFDGSQHIRPLHAAKFG